MRGKTSGKDALAQNQEYGTIWDDGHERGASDGLRDLPDRQDGANEMALLYSRVLIVVHWIQHRENNLGQEYEYRGRDLDHRAAVCRQNTRVQYEYSHTVFVSYSFTYTNTYYTYVYTYECQGQRV